MLGNISPYLNLNTVERVTCNSTGLQRLRFQVVRASSGRACVIERRRLRSPRPCPTLAPSRARIDVGPPNLEISDANPIRDLASIILSSPSLPGVPTFATHRPRNCQQARQVRAVPRTRCRPAAAPFLRNPATRSYSHSRMSRTQASDQPTSHSPNFCHPPVPS
jgi:hypothetical protein